MLLEQVAYSIFKGFELGDLKSMFDYKGQELEDTYDTAYNIMCCAAQEGKLEDIKYVVNWFKKSNLMIRPTHMVKNGRSWTGAWIWENESGMACCITCTYDVRMCKPKEAIEIDQWLKENGYTPLMEMRAVVGGEGRSVFVMGFKQEGCRYECKLSRLLPNCHPRCKAYLDVNNNVVIPTMS